MAKERIKIQPCTVTFMMIEKTVKGDIESYKDILEYIDSIEQDLRDCRGLLRNFQYQLSDHNFNNQ